MKSLEQAESFLDNCGDLLYTQLMCKTKSEKISYEYMQKAMTIYTESFRHFKSHNDEFIFCKISPAKKM